MNGEPRGTPDRTELGGLHPGDRGPSENPGGHVVRVALQARGKRDHLCVGDRVGHTSEVRGHRQPTDDRRGRGPQTPALRHRVDAAKAQPAGSQLTGPVERHQPGANDPGDQVGVVRGHPTSALTDHLDRDRRTLDEARLDPIGQAQGQAQAVESRTKVGARGRHLDGQGRRGRRSARCTHR